LRLGSGLGGCDRVLGALVGPVRRGARVAAAVVAAHCADGWSAEGGHDKHGTDSPDDSDARSVRSLSVCLSCHTSCKRSLRSKDRSVGSCILAGCKEGISSDPGKVELNTEPGNESI
jgi:hypothetical protein